MCDGWHVGQYRINAMCLHLNHVRSLSGHKRKKKIRRVVSDATGKSFLTAVLTERVMVLEV